ncbi:flavin reductase [Clostridium butyricum]|nr:flavin reductase [Clostridium butyricum]
MNKVEMKGSVILNPVPVVLVTSKNKEGKTNVFTVGWTGTINTKPPMLYISIRPERLSYEYIKETKEFVVNLPGSNLVKAVDYCGVRSGKRNDKIKELGFTLSESSNISVPYIDECPINIECKVKDIIPLGTHDMFIAEVVGSHINEDLFDEDGKIHFENANMMAYCHGEYFPLQKHPVGSFGFSVMKKKTKKKTASSKEN